MAMAKVHVLRIQIQVLWLAQHSYSLSHFPVPEEGSLVWETVANVISVQYVLPRRGHSKQSIYLLVPDIHLKSILC